MTAEQLALEVLPASREKVSAKLAEELRTKVREAVDRVLANK